jgi:Zn-dependent protease
LETGLDFLDLASSIGFALLVGVALTIFVTGVRASRIRLRNMETQPVDLTGVPAGDRVVLEIGRRWLMPRGFRYASSWRTRPMIESKGGALRHSDVYFNESLRVFAVVSLREQPQPGDVASIVFQSVLPDGTLVETCNRYRHAIVWEPPRWLLDDIYSPDMEVVLRHHLSRVKATGAAPLADPAVRDRAVRERVEGYVAALVAIGRAANHGTEIRMRLGPAIAYAAKLLRGNWRAASVKAIPLEKDGSYIRPSDGGAEPGVAADINAYHARRAIHSATSGAGKWRFGAISAIAFVVVGAALWDWIYAVYVLLVIAIHEGGHYLAMKMVGYRNLNVFFLPGLGGLATGEKQDATPVQKVFVYLAGPVPGIVMAVAGLLLIPAGSALAELNALLYIMLVINVINLLPVTPLDGGRVLEVILFARWPTLRFLFAAAGCLVLLAVGALWGERVMLILGVLVAFSLPAQWRFSRLALTVDRPAGKGLDEASATQRVFSALARAPFNRWSFQQRSTAADELISELRTPVAGFATMTAGLAIYAACFAAPALTAWMASPALRDGTAGLMEMRDLAAEMADEPKDAAEPARPERNWAAELERARTGPADKYLALLVEATEEGYLPPGPEDYQARFSELRRISETLPRGNAVRGQALLAASRGSEASVDARRDSLRALFDEYRDAPDESALVKARIGSALADVLEPSPERLALLAASRDVMRARLPAGDAAAGDAWSQLARERARLGDFAAAEAEWRDLIAWHAGVARRDFVGRSGADEAQLGLAMFLVARGRLDDAEALIRPPVDEAMAQAAQGKRRALMARGQSIQALFWIAISRRDAAQARQWMDAWEKSAGAYGRSSSQLTLARLALADASGNAAATQEAKAKLAAHKGVPGMCKMWMGNPDNRADEFAPARRSVLERHGVCRSSPA